MNQPTIAALAALAEPEAGMKKGPAFDERGPH
jgi:hypothetical protein